MQFDFELYNRWIIFRFTSNVFKFNGHFISAVEQTRKLFPKVFRVIRPRQFHLQN